MYSWLDYTVVCKLQLPWGCLHVLYIKTGCSLVVIPREGKRGSSAGRIMITRRRSILWLPRPPAFA